MRTIPRNLIKKQAPTVAAVKQPITAKDKAKDAVKTYEAMVSDLSDMEKTFERDFPDAAVQVRGIAAFRDEIHDKILEAKDAIRAAEISFGDFVFTPKFSKAGYDPNKLVNICVATKDTELLFEMVKAGAFSFKINHKEANLFFDKTTELSEKVSGAWAERKPMTASVRTPKF